jgi:serine protease Do
LRSLADAFSAVAEGVSVSRKGVQGSPEEMERFREFLGEEFSERFPWRRREEPRATGSGLIMNPNGYILTNNHVIENAQDINVRLSDSRTFTARLVGRDPKTDLAVLKGEAPAALPAAALADSDRLRVGQWAIAGSPADRAGLRPAGGGRNEYLVLERPGRP